ncbi:hypothetical protein F183_A04900 [Bryobacterales bacterium F-183]|nr:hypothetical protein F183_A04900 [Bryobacterales bacterium F-183]
MAHRTFPLYNLSASVGKGGVNRTDDVRLVQVLITQCLPTVTMQMVTQRAKENNVPAPSSLVSVTGNYNDDLGKWIVLLQTQTKKMGVNCATDGRIDPIPIERNTLDYASTGKNGKQYYLLIMIRSAIHLNAKAYLDLGERLTLPYILDGSQAALNL